MISIHEWKMKQLGEETTTPVVNPQEEPNEDDWDFYHQRIQGRAYILLNKFLTAIEGKNLSLIKRGFIVQEIMNTLGLTLPQYVKIVSNVKRAMQKKQQLMSNMNKSAVPPVEQNPTPSTTMPNTEPNNEPY